jgi:hypothetical protein
MRPVTRRDGEGIDKTGKIDNFTRLTGAGKTQEADMVDGGVRATTNGKQPVPNVAHDQVTDIRKASMQARLPTRLFSSAQRRIIGPFSLSLVRNDP